MRFSGAIVVLALAFLPAVQAGGAKLAGNWKVTLFIKGQQLSFWLLKLETRDGKLTGSAVPLRQVEDTTLTDLEVKGDRLAFTLHLENQSFSFEGNLTGSKKIHGSFVLGTQIVPAVLEATRARTPFELDKEMVARSPDDPRVFAIVKDLVKQAQKEKANLKEVREWTEVAVKLSEKYGDRMQRETAISLAESLVSQEGFAEVAADLARNAERIPGGAELQLRALGVLETALKKLGQADQAKTVAARMDKLENKAHHEYEKTALPFKPGKFTARKGKSNRAVLIELFTGAQCPPCVAADLAFDALKKTYPSSEAVLLQYHLHIPGPDSLTNPDSEARQEYYGKLIRGTPSILFNGKSAAPGGGGRDDSQDKYKEYRQVIDPLLEKPASVQLQVSAFRKGNKVHIRAQAGDLDQPGAAVRLRLALVEDWVRYRGRNGLSYHSRVVRALPGGPRGLALTKKDSAHVVVQDLDELERNLSKYLDNFARTEAHFPDSQRPMRFRNLRAVAFVQNDDTQEVLQALEVPVQEE